jgi:hypothetical protein
MKYSNKARVAELKADVKYHRKRYERLQRLPFNAHVTLN